ncbi:alpha/beta hydrolase family protein [Stackebrandtia nassauensis]|uniref:Platelet-activating factor acetylhydrolase plasma/intracellular isoform II n=1 Tax=Stackebrandtia nassauensis (strain DSM 44728 / CIP 108903 / NRRL B-16338 / NBRC 102104 / LLR-40K-21) TaxID=446470 RepID=D3PZG7_STANL|nr:alpha/beta hydrolase [Stackebrandtia nassauensis]ADD41641.1 Platelet-activating factor acetylhydrolase plasma/intracellular isoform II [Stackebrandtia nassauensis DSM 44728]
MRRKWLLAAAVTAVAVSGAAVAVTGHAQENDAEGLALIEPTGDHAVGTTMVQLEDSTRDDIWAPEEKRRLMVSLYYPAKPGGDGETAPYLTYEESKQFLEKPAPDAPPDALAKVRTHALVDAKPDTKDDDRPLVMLSPGFGFPRATLTGLAEELASHGTIVALVGHNYEAPTTLLDGTTTPCLACSGGNDGEKVADNRAKDLSFVLDTLTGKKSPWKGSKLIDTDAVAVGGHSMGGASAHTAMVGDRRFDAGFNLDGTFHPEKGRKLNRPFMMVGAQKHGQPGADKSWTDRWGKLTGWKRWLSVKQTGHSSMTDVGYLGPKIGVPQQELDGERCTEIAREYVSAFVDTQLRDEDDPILDGPSQEFPEVSFHSP